MNRSDFVLAFVMCVALVMHGATNEMGEISALLRSNGLQSKQSGEYSLPMYHGANYYLVLDPAGTPVKAGVRLMSQSTKDCMPPLIGDFIERYALRLALTNAGERKRLMADDKVKTEVGKLMNVDSLCDIKMTMSNKLYEVSWTKNKKPVASISFPAEYGLIAGMNKIECERHFQYEIKHIDGQLQDINLQTVTPEELTQSKIDTSLYVRKGVCYFIKDLNSDAFYLRSSDDQVIPVNSSMLAAETVSNLFQSIVGGNYTLHVVQNLYGYKKATYDVPLASYIKLCQKTGCNSYVGIEQIDETQVKAVVVSENKMLGYNHLLSVVVKRSTLAKKSGTLEASLYAYIPTHNLKSLFNVNEIKK